MEGHGDLQEPFLLMEIDASLLTFDCIDGDVLFSGSIHDPQSLPPALDFADVDVNLDEIERGIEELVCLQEPGNSLQASNGELNQPQQPKRTKRTPKWKQDINNPNLSKVEKQSIKKAQQCRKQREDKSEVVESLKKEIETMRRKLAMQENRIKELQFENSKLRQQHQQNPST